MIMPNVNFVGQLFLLEPWPCGQTLRTECKFKHQSSAGEHILAGDDIYGGTSRLLGSVAPDLGIEVSNVDHTDLNAFKRAFVPKKTKLVILESPTNPRMRVCLHSFCCFDQLHGIPPCTSS